MEFLFSVPVALSVVIVLVLLYWQYWRWTHRRMLELAAKVPGPTPLPIIGNALIFLCNPEEQLGKIQELMRTYGQYVRFWLGPDLNIVLKNPADVRYLLTSNKVNQKGPLYDILKKFIGPGILTGGPTWRSHRKIAMPSYNKKSVQVFMHTFNREADELVRSLLQKNPGDNFDIFHNVLQCTTQCVCQTLMGLSKEESMNVKRMDEVVRITQSMYSLIFRKMTIWWLQIPFIFWLLGGQSKEDYFVKAADEMTSDILEKRRSAKERVEEDAMGIVDRYLLSGELSDQEVKWETFSLFTTSQEASAKIASAVLLFLAYLPDWQRKVYEEIMDTIGAYEENITEEQLKKLGYLDMVYKEALRYLSIAALIQRTVEDEVSVDNGNITLPAGTSLTIPIHDIHRDPQYWDEPEKIRPERFYPENVKKRDPNAFIPFSLGAMDCLGRVYATALIKTIVVKIIRQLELETDSCPEDLELHVAISVRFSKGYHVRVRPRKTTVHAT